jgi:hypothetical protein
MVAVKKALPVYMLIDGVDRNKECPDTFEIPTEAERQNAKVGEYVKLGFEHTVKSEDKPGAERMWVLIKRVIQRKGAETKYVGELNNDPFSFDGALVCGDTVEFKARHILSTMED